MFLQHYNNSKSRKNGFRALHIQRTARGLSNSFRLVHQQEPKSFLRQIRSPGHLLFFASNVALLIHVKSVSTTNKQAEMEKYLLHMNELENYEEVIKNLDAQEKAIREQIAFLKSKRAKKKPPSSLEEHHKAKKAPLSRMESLKQSYFNQRADISSVLSKGSNINQLFRMCNRPCLEDSSHVNEVFSQKKTHSSTISHSLMMMSNMFVKSFLVELNLRSAFDDLSISELCSRNNYLLCQNLFQSMKNDLSKEGLYQQLVMLCGRSHTNSNPIWHHLDDGTLSELRLGFQHSDHFRSKESMRLDYFHHKSGKCLNYDNANKARHIFAIQAPTFNSDIESSAAYIEDFRKFFAKYKADSHPMKHLNLVLSIAQRLIQNGDCVPQVSIFRELLALFGDAKLYNYQSLVYDTLPEFKHVKSVLVDGEKCHEFAKKKVTHLASIIQQDPSILASLIKYQVIKNDPDTLKSLIEYLEPTQTASDSRNFILPAFMLSWRCNPIFHKADLQGAPLISTSVIEYAIEACVELKEYELIDKILAKLVFDSVQVSEGIRITLGKHTNFSYLSQTVSESAARKQLFSDTIILLLGKAYLESGDKLRCNWLASLVSDILVDSPTENLKQLHKEILRFTNGEKESKRNTQHELLHDSANHGPINRNKSQILFHLKGNVRADSEMAHSINVQNAAIA